MSYTPPEVWTFDSENGGAFASINRPTAGARFERELPRGQHPLQLYSLATPNGQKVTIMLEELLALGISGAEYDAWLVSISQGDQFGSGFVAVNPNSKIPALLDYAPQQATPDGGPLRLFESGSMLLYLAEKFAAELAIKAAPAQALLPASLSGRTETLNWLFWQMGSTPFVGGGFGHFFKYAPEKLQYPIDRYTMETKRQLDVLNQQLALSPFVAGEHYSIADIAIWPWYGQIVLGSVYDAARFLDAGAYPHLLAWAEKIAARPAVQRGIRVNRNWGDEATQLAERHQRSDFDPR